MKDNFKHLNSKLNSKNNKDCFLNHKRFIAEKGGRGGATLSLQIESKVVRKHSRLPQTFATYCFHFSLKSFQHFRCQFFFFPAPAPLPAGVMSFFLLLSGYDLLTIESLSGVCCFSLSWIVMSVAKRCEWYMCLFFFFFLLFARSRCESISK